MKLGDVTLVKDCLLCDSEVILLATRNSKGELPEKNSVLPQVCESCRDKYLKEGVLLLNPDNCNLVVISDSLFNNLFDTTLPTKKIAFTEQVVLDRINEIYNSHYPNKNDHATE